MVESFAPSARSTWSQTVVLDRSARWRRNAALDVGPAPVKTAAPALSPFLYFCLRSAEPHMLSPGRVSLEATGAGIRMRAGRL